MWVERLTPKASPEELVEFNKRLISKFVSSDKSILQRAEETFGRLFQEFQHINHNDQFHGTESLIYHQYLVMHSFNTFMELVCDDLSASDPFVRHLESLLKSLEERTSIGKKELKELLNENPPSCSKDLKTLLFLAALFHDIGKLYNTEKWEKEFADETLRLRKFQRHAGYGSLLFRILALRQGRYTRIFSSITSVTHHEIAKLESELPTAQGNQRLRLQQKINILRIDIHYLVLCSQKIEDFKSVLEEFSLKKKDYQFIAALIEHHQDLLNDPSVSYEAAIKEKEPRKIKDFIKWSREKKLGFVGILERNRGNDFIFYGLMLINLSDVNGTGFSDHTIRAAFKTYKEGDLFEGHHGDIRADAEFFGFLAYLYHNLSLSNEEIMKNWFNIEEKKKPINYNWDSLYKKLPDNAGLIEDILESEGPGGLAKKGFNVREIMAILKGE